MTSWSASHTSQFLSLSANESAIRCNFSLASRICLQILICLLGRDFRRLSPLSPATFARAKVANCVGDFRRQHCNREGPAYRLRKPKANPKMRAFWWPGLLCPAYSKSIWHAGRQLLLFLVEHAMCLIWRGGPSCLCARRARIATNGRVWTFPPEFKFLRGTLLESLYNMIKYVFNTSNYIF